MTPIQILNKLKKEIRPGISLVSAIEIFIRFFSVSQVEGCPKEADGDMLLFQWGGPYSWDSHVSINLTRQFSFVDEDGEHAGMQQLQMNCRYQVGQLSVGKGNTWLHGDDVEAFLHGVLQSSSVIAARDLLMISLELSLARV
jgi:hypothetical protein